jgi:hypothetical protein
MILYIENPKKYILELINEFNKAVGYKANSKKSTVFYILAVNIYKVNIRKQPHL